MAKKGEIKKSFYDWCIENNHKDWLELWDYELNSCSPKDVGFRSKDKYWFKCHRGIHPSEFKRLDNITSEKSLLKCKQCNSFGQWLIDTYGDNALELYWDYKKNKVNPFEISKSCDKKVWIFCQEKDYHGSYEIGCGSFTNGRRCSYCKGKYKIHPKDSIGQRLIDYYGEDAIERYWSEKNKISPFEVAPYSIKKCWFICQKDEEHEDYKITASNFTQGSRCSVCKESRGERKIREILNTYNIDFIAQKTFPNLLGIKNGSLTYDFYIPKHNLLIEYQGGHHDGTVRYSNETQEEYEKRFKKRQEHDRRKREYAELHNIRLLEIWYWDFDNIETILKENIK